MHCVSIMLSLAAYLFCSGELLSHHVFQDGVKGQSDWVDQRPGVLPSPGVSLAVRQPVEPVPRVSLWCSHTPGTSSLSLSLSGTDTSLT